MCKLVTFISNPESSAISCLTDSRQKFKLQRDTGKFSDFKLADSNIKPFYMKLLKGTLICWCVSHWSIIKVYGVSLCVINHGDRFEDPSLTALSILSFLSSYDISLPWLILSVWPKWISEWRKQFLLITSTFEFLSAATMSMYLSPEGRNVLLLK